ncbi:hypothetical protein CYY_007093 [Polysphondylium violaceum]|uniref:Uncharacterized protein n=1 Tax=Polysphondylium violaceum TaxID=133409 RepID=A0A8J4PSD3_9MYCE|nr:hypothetical protein CYY_007093 [Polysphondylium violaceum]
MISGVTSHQSRLNNLMEKENSGGLSTLSLKKSSTTLSSSGGLGSGPIKQKAFGSSGAQVERRALGEITNKNKQSLPTSKKSSGSSDNKLLFVPSSTTPQLKKKINVTNTPSLILANNTKVESKKNNYLPYDPIYPAPPAPLRVNSTLSNKAIESFVMTPSLDIPISSFTDTFERDVYLAESLSFTTNSSELCFDDPSSTDSLMIEDNFSFSDYYNDIVL